MSMLKPGVRGMLMAVRDAAQDGRFMFGNGADWFIVDHRGIKVHLNTVNVTRTEVPEYNGTAGSCAAAARILNGFLASSY